jgi:ABC-type multidrug transport system ATPase subunit
VTSFAVQTEALTRCFGSLTAVDGIDLAVPRGCVYGFLGPNGSGKTTTFRLLLGLIRPHAGRVRILGDEMPRHRLAVLRRTGALVETPSLYPHLTGRENLEVTRRLIEGKRARVQEVLHLVRLEEAADRLVKGYSLGMRQRLGLALALLGEPDLLILDEPTNGLDPAGIREMRAFIRSVPQEMGATVLLASHLLSEVEQVATHIGIIHRGKIVFQGTKEALQAQLREYLSIGVECPDQAEQLLTTSGWTVRRNGSDHLHVPVGGRSEAAMINRQLIDSGHNVFDLHLERASLEDIFIEMTGQEDSA